jgi:hypothetical protein
MPANRWFDVSIQGQRATGSAGFLYFYKPQAARLSVATERAACGKQPIRMDGLSGTKYSIFCPKQRGVSYDKKKQD